MSKRPPLGIKPRYIWLEERCDELIKAIERQEQSKNPNRRLIEQWRHELFTGEFELNITESVKPKSDEQRRIEGRLAGLAFAEATGQILKIALKLRFVLLKSEIIMEVLDGDKRVLGVTDNLAASKSPQAQILSWLRDESEWDTFRFSRNNGDFDYLQESLDVFVAGGCFHGEKPVPRIQRAPLTHPSEELSSEMFDVYLSEGFTLTWTKSTLNDLVVMCGNSLPIYEPKQFKSEWKKISPREFTVEEITEYIDLPSAEVSGIDFALMQINQYQIDLPEVWEFTIESQGKQK